MAITKTTHPYEFLCRWDENTGAFKAYHFKTVTTVKDGAEVLAVKESGAMNAQMAQEAGFPIADILTALHVDAMKAVDVAVVERDAAKAEAAEATANESVIKAAHDKLAEELQTLKAAAPT